mgnify:CR=1 FL=1
MPYQNVSTYFDRSEFACKCGCGFDTVDVSTLSILDLVRRNFGPVYINSGCRCSEHNKAVGGSPNSQHLRGRAADIRVRNASLQEVADWVDREFPNASIGMYNTFIHIDTRTNGPARWDMRN